MLRNQFPASRIPGANCPGRRYPHAQVFAQKTTGRFGRQCPAVAEFDCRRKHRTRLRRWWRAASATDRKCSFARW